MVFSKTQLLPFEGRMYYGIRSSLDSWIFKISSGMQKSKVKNTFLAFNYRKDNMHTPFTSKVSILKRLENWQCLRDRQT